MPLPEGESREAEAPTTFTQEIPSAATGVTMALVEVGVSHETAPPPFWISTTEITWDVYDVFVFELDLEDDEEDLDGVSRPSKPYVPPDRGFGHAGYAAIGMTRKAAEEFCVWLSARSGRTYRLPTEAEWRLACVLGGTGEAPADERAWHSGNADRKTQPVAKKAPNALGLYDMHGNVAEWIAGDGKPTALGGSYRQDAGAIGCDHELKQDTTWNMSDPQIPKSQWWLADCSWVGFRVVCEDDGDAPPGGSR